MRAAMLSCTPPRLFQPEAILLALPLQWQPGGAAAGCGAAAPEPLPAASRRPRRPHPLLPFLISGTRPGLTLH